MQANIAPIKPAPGLEAKPVQLHVVHDLGGGTATWLEDFSRADAQRTNLVLKSITHQNAMGTALALFARVGDEMPLRIWNLTSEIAATSAAHAEYRRILDEIIAEHRVDVILVSSFIGHALDVLDTGLPTVVVTHDYFPYCPAINIHFDGVCRACDGKRIGECYRGNPKFNPFVTFLPADRVRVRERFMDLARRPNVTLATPSRSVQDNLVRLNPRFSEVAFQTIPHGYGRALQKLPAAEPSPDERLKVLVLGQLSELKGVELLRGALSALNKFADVWLIGAREVGESFKYYPGVHVLNTYQVDDLPYHVAHLNPHVALLMSVAPETFSYALTELMMLGVPVAATRVGSFPERIRHGEDGYLFDPNVPSLVAALGAINADRENLSRVRRNVAQWTPRSAEEMVSDYHRITPVEARPRAPYPVPAAPVAEKAPAEQAFITQAMTLSSMWKDVKSLQLQLKIEKEAREREQVLYVEASKELAAAEKKIAEDEASNEAALAERDMRIQSLTTHVQMKNGQLVELVTSTSWKVSWPVRAVGRIVRALKALGGYARTVARYPASWPESIRQLLEGLRKGGIAGLKRTLLEMQSWEGREHAWDRYRRTYLREVQPRIIERVATMEDPPLISVLVATYDTDEDMLRLMLDTVRAQLYRHWELCIVDDGSTQHHIADVLKEYAALDKRIRPQVGGENKGVSHALNRALGMARGDFVVLLDHDDYLEEQALFRVAESILEDNPDMLYADEVTVKGDVNDIRQYTYRPAFSLEYLRSHPFIVHPVGFRTELLRDIGGFDENLRISQDYDLILRAIEKARVITHIPELLYRWRIHGSSAGTQKLHDVMETSKAVLRGHLERCGAKGEVNEGERFNLFDVRYPLAAGLKVAIIIPTKNHGKLLRQCIESIWASVTGVAYDIVVVDHESDDPATLEYFDSIRSDVRVIRYEGKFNFSAINNWAVKQVAGPYSHYLFCNNDIEAYEPGWLERMLELGQQPSVGIVGAKLFYPDRETIQHAGVCVGTYGAAEHYGKRVRVPQDVELGYWELLLINREVSAVTAACMLIRSDVFKEVSGFDETIAVGFGDVDLCLRVGERGLRILYCGHARLVHHESYTRGTSKKDPHPEDSALYRFKWLKMLESGDPYYNPGLSINSTVWLVKQPLQCSYGIRRRIVERDPKSGRQKVTFSTPAA
jgi:GT2 family glycosyltransferase/glycosyltransferase involved in cell wall biosynthesis